MFTPTVYFYDAFPGGMGQSEPLFVRRDVWAAQPVALNERRELARGSFGCGGPVLAADETDARAPKALALSVRALWSAP